MAPETPVNFILGTHTVGDNTRDPIAVFDKEEDIQALLDAFGSRGYQHVDTAADYPPEAPGTSEDRLGRAGAASKFIVHTKVHSGTAGDHEPAKITQSIEKSLAYLKTSTLETVFLHVPDRQTPFKDTAKAINDAIQQGKVKNFGLSNYSAAEVKQFIDICEEMGYVKPSVYQGHYNAVVRSGEKELFPLLREHNIAFFAYSPAAGGLFSGKLDSSTRFQGDNPVAKIYKGFYGKVLAQMSFESVQEAVKRHGITGHEAAIRWAAFHSVLDGQFGDGVIFGFSKLEQVKKTLAALEAGPLPADVADTLSAVYATVEGSEPPYHL